MFIEDRPFKTGVLCTSYNPCTFVPLLGSWTGGFHAGQLQVVRIRARGCLRPSGVLGPCLHSSCCPLLNHNEIACVQPEGVTLADLLKEDKKKRKFCFRQRRAKDHGKCLRLDLVSGRRFSRDLCRLCSARGARACMSRVPCL